VERTARGAAKSNDTGFLLGVSDNKLLLDGIPLETGQAERSFAQLLNAAGLSSIMFSRKVTLEDFTRLVRAFSMGGSKAQDFAKQIKETLGDNKDSSIRINEVKFVAADPTTGRFRWRPRSPLKLSVRNSRSGSTILKNFCS